MTDAESRFKAGQIIAGYTIIRTLGAGGMGTVYLVQHPRLPRTQALKVLASGLGRDQAFRERFKREADLASRLDHPNVVAVQDAGVEDDLMWIAMQYIDGVDAAAMLRGSRDPLPALLIADVIGQVASALDYAHSQGTLHRDVKPANILLTPGLDQPAATRRAFIGDFGVARLLTDSNDLTGTGNMIGTLAYAAPELFAGSILTPAVDVYALGCSFYELLAGQPVFPRPDQISVMGAHATAPVPRLTAIRHDLPRAFDEVIARALAKRPEDRFPTCGALAAAAAAALRSAESVVSTIVSPVQPHHAIATPQPHPGAFDRTMMAGPQLRNPYSEMSPPYGPHRSGSARRRGPLPWILAGASLLVAVVVAAAVALVINQDKDGSDAASGVSTTVAASKAAPVSSAVAAPENTAATPATATLAGNWQGTVSGDQTGFDVKAQIPSGAPIVAAVEYPQIGCAGTWSERSRQGETVNLTEFIDRGTCVTSDITLTPKANGTLAFRSSYYSQSRDRTFVIYATLQRY